MVTNKRTDKKKVHEPIIIIGAPRSGTNMLKDVLSSFPGLTTFPCEEINPIWRHGNVNHPNDELTPEMATDYVKSYIRGRFTRLKKKTGAKRIVEKSCANSLRVDFVHEVFPDAKFVHIVRDGVDVCASAQKKRVFNPFDVSFHWAKLKHVPAKDLPHYIFKFAVPRVIEVVKNGGRLSSWGPTTNGVPNGSSGDTDLLLCAHSGVSAYQNLLRRLIRWTTANILEYGMKNLSQTQPKFSSRYLNSRGKKYRTIWVIMWTVFGALV